VKGLVNWVMGFLTDGPELVYDGVGEAVTGSNWDLANSCKGGWIRLISPSVNLEADLVWGLYSACMYGHVDCARLMVELGGTNLNKGLTHACAYGHPACAQLMVNSGATELDWGIFYACRDGHKVCAELMVESGATACGHCNGAKHTFK
jgi:hypothetical protein